jgi:hypothetical protein
MVHVEEEKMRWCRWIPRNQPPNAFNVIVETLTLGWKR